MLRSKDTEDFAQNAFDQGKGYDYLNQQLRIVLSNVDQIVKEKLRNEHNPSEMVSWHEYNSWI